MGKSFEVLPAVGHVRPLTALEVGATHNEDEWAQKLAAFVDSGPLQPKAHVQYMACFSPRVAPRACTHGCSIGGVYIFPVLLNEVKVF
jgi:hypothetical protein